MMFWKRPLNHGIAKGCIVALVLTLPTLAQVFSATQDFSNLTVNNNTGMTINAMDITAKDGTVVAHLFIEGKSMTFGGDQRPIRGAGTIAGAGQKKVSVLILPPGKPSTSETQANKAKARLVSVKDSGGMLTTGSGIPFGSGEIPDLGSGTAPQGSLILKMGFISWNEDGSTKYASELYPTIACSNGKKVKITSDLAKPVVKAGLVLIDTGSGKLALRIRFGGYGTAEGSTDSLCATGNK
jgi:hypothetical protein